MSQIDAAKAKASALEIQAGLRMLGEHRTLALLVHKTKELVANLEAKMARLIE